MPWPCRGLTHGSLEAPVGKVGSSSPSGPACAGVWFRWGQPQAPGAEVGKVASKWAGQLMLGIQREGPEREGGFTPFCGK